MARDIDYEAINIDTSKPRSEYHYTERRAEILQAIKKKGHPSALNQASLAREYDVSEAQISKDMNVLREYIVDNIDTTRVDAITQQVYQTSIQELLDQGEYEKAAKVTEKWNNWLFDRGKVDKEPDKHEHTGEGGSPLEISIQRVTEDNVDEFED